MKRLTYFFMIAAFAALVFAGTASAQISATATGSASATIIKGISIEKTADLEFSEIISNGTGGTVFLNNTGSVLYNGVKAYPGSKAPQTAKFVVQGEAGKMFNITLPEEFTIKNSADNSMIVNDIHHNPYPGFPSLDSNGTETFTVGAQLNVNANQEAGIYTGEFQVSVNYQ